VSGEALLLKDVGAMHGQTEPKMRAKATAKAEGADRATGEGTSGGLRGSRTAREGGDERERTELGHSQNKREGIQTTFKTFIQLNLIDLLNGLHKVESNQRSLKQ
jgi:hypothetical protein